MKNVINTIVLLSFFSLGAMLQKPAIKLIARALDSNPSEILNVRIDPTGRDKKLFYHDFSHNRIFGFPAIGLEQANCSVDKENGSAYLQLIYSRRIECWKLEEGKSEFSCVKSISMCAGYNFVAISDDDQFLIAEQWIEGKRTLKVFKELSLISECEVGNLARENDQWIVFDATNTFYAVHLTSKAYEGSRWYIIDLNIGEILSTIWTINSVIFTEDGLIDDGEGNLYKPTTGAKIERINHVDLIDEPLLSLRNLIL